MNAPRTRRTAQEILAERKAQLATAEARAAREIAQDTPAAQAILAEIEATTKDLTLARRGFVKGRQNFENRIRSHSMWIAEIEAERTLANANISLFEERKEKLEENLSAVLSEIAETGSAPDESQIEGMIFSSINHSYDLYSEPCAEAGRTHTAAQMARKDFTDSLKPSKKDENENTAEACAEA